MSKSLTTNPDCFSDDAWNLILASEEEAKRWRHEYLDIEHLLQVLFTERIYQETINALPINQAELLDKLEEFLASIETTKSNKLFVGEDLEILFDTANNFRCRWGSKFIEISHLLIAIGRDKRIGTEIFNELGLTSEILEGELRRLPKNIKSKKILNRNTTNSNFSIKNDQTREIKPSNIIRSDSVEIVKPLKIENQPSPLEIYGKDLTLAAKKGELDPVIGREEEIHLTIKVLSRRGKNNPILIGAPGVGKTAIAELLAQKIVVDEVPDSIKSLQLISLDIGALIAGAKFRGQFEERLRSILEEASKTKSGVVLFIDDLHTILSPERSSTDAGSILKPILAKGDIRCIGTTTPENYRRTIEKDQALNRRFQQIMIKEPNIDLSVEILRGIKERYESHHGVKITDEALIAANRFADRYISDRCLPDKAIDLIDEASAQLKMEANNKPKIILATESKINELELKLIDREKFSQLGEIENIEKEIDLTAIHLNNLLKKWKQEKELMEELNELNKDEEDTKVLLAKAEEEGNLEEAARLKNETLNDLKQKIYEINYSIENDNTLIKYQVEEEDIADIVARWTGIPVNKVLAGEKQKLLDLEKDLANKVIGQPEAVKAVAAAIKRARAGMKDKRRPIGSFLFLGPTGVGKTELAKTLAASLFDESEALIRLDMSEFMERNAVARLIGAPPGYVGYEEGGQLTESIRRKPYSVLLLDEIEKAHSDVFNILLQVLDDGRLTDSQGRTIDFRHTVVVMTSNLASRAILENAKLLQQQIQAENDLEANLDATIEKALNQQFRPEFLNRIDEIIRFSPINKENLKKIIQLQLIDLTNLLAEQNLEFRIDNATIEALALEAYEPEYGARPLSRILRRRIENPLATKLLEDKFIGAKAIRVITSDENPNSLEFLAEN
ncbi:ATP-dependent Clp protease ATP-binding subunit [Prochlorococcus marinus]|uniref:ATP-dependent Clp protease ATP-binding subunit n=1 Tax=Prochlorococcus marinus TaxID=1219 RepID=UPI0022B3F441|nr:AAA family ATPase [Prochlorococcus marinus]